MSTPHAPRRSRRTPRGRLAALAVASGVTLLAVSGPAPAYAADRIEGGNASAATVTAGGQSQGTGTFAARFDGRRLTTSGTREPAISVLGGQSLISAGTLAQDATASADGSAACAGIAGQGATLARVGEGECLTGGDVLHLDSGSVDLSGLEIVGDDVTANLPPEAREALATVLGQVTTEASAALQEVLGQLGDPGLVVDLGVIEGTCAADASGPSGEARLANAGVRLQIPDREPLTLLTLPEKPAPDSEYSADLGQLSALVLADLEAQLTEGLDGQLGPAAAVVSEATVISGILTEVSKQLRPVTGQVIKIVANAQTRTDTSIDLTALDLRLLPGAVEGADAFRLQLGHVQCGPSEVVQAAAAPPAEPGLPVGVSAGLETAPSRPAAQTEPLVPLKAALTGGVTFGLLLLAGLAAAHRRRLV